MANKICVECGSNDLQNCAPEYPHIDECNACGHPNDADAPDRLEETINSVDSELDWSIVDKPFPNDKADEILGLSVKFPQEYIDEERDWNNEAQRQSDADYESGAPTPYDM